ncbi:MAG: 4-phosphoerythronate dehydrogenase [Saccharospirillum sp.]
MTLNRPLRIVADENMPLVEPWFSGLAESITRLPGRTLRRQDLEHADVLLVRSVTPVNQALLADTPVRFVGSATIGTDHIDQSWLAEAGIAFAHAPGSNAQSVVDWLLSVQSRLQQDLDLPWWEKTLGVVGAGRVGSRVVERLRALGATVLVCDPPRAEREGTDGFTDLDTLLAVSDIVCLHTPYTRSGPHATAGMLNGERLARMKAGAWLISAGRGPVVESDALSQALQQQRIRAVLDVWPDEPVIAQALLEATYLGSPHVAGYSQEGKWAGTRMLAEALYADQQQPLPDAPTVPQAPRLDARFFDASTPEALGAELILALYDPARDHAALSHAAEQGRVSADAFDALRKAYPPRRELASARLVNVPEEAKDWLGRLGFGLGRG